MRRIPLKFNLVLLGVVLICGCNYEDITRGALKKTTSPADDKFAQGYFDIVRSHNYKMALSLLCPETRATVQESDIENIASYIDSNDINSVELIGSKVIQKNDMKIAEMTYQYQIGENWFLANIGVGNVNGKQEIAGFQVTPIPKSLQELNAFTFAGKGIIHYLFFAFMISIVALTLYGVVVCIRSRIRMKWLWIIFIFFGVGQLSLNWTTGQIFFNLFSIKFGVPSAVGMTKSLSVLYAPWVMYIYIPIGLIVFFFKRKKLINTESGMSE